MYSLLLHHIKYLYSAYTRYASAAHDEGFRKFLSSMSSQEEANLDSVEEHADALKSYQVDTKSLAEVVRTLESAHKDLNGLLELERIEFLEYMLVIEKLSARLYKECEQTSQSEAAAEFLHSLHEDEKRHIALLRDRYELEQLL
ncbi:MAG: hypothetical protein ACOCW5_03030 [Spirochaetia bacterium]